MLLMSLGNYCPRIIIFLHGETIYVSLMGQFLLFKLCLT